MVATVCGTRAGANENEATRALTPPETLAVSLTRAEIRRFLLPFKEEWIFAEEATFHGGKLISTFRTFNDPFVQPPQHLTRNHIIMFTTQASYLFGGCCAKCDHAWPVGEDEYCDLIASEQATFTEVRLRFREFMPNRDRVCLTMWSNAQRVYKGKLVIDIRFAFDSACSGRFKAILAVDRSFLPGTRSEIVDPGGRIE